MAVGVYIPLYNQVEWCRAVELPQGVNIVAVDNRSDDGSPETLRERGVQVIENDHNLGRLGNWQATIEAFLASDDEWMKWLFAGDALTADAIGTLERNAHAHPEARLIIAEYDIELRGQRERWSTLPETRMVSPAAAMALSAAQGNWFGAPIAYCVHRDALKRGYDFGHLPWVADWQFCISIASRHPVLYLGERVGVFKGERRTFFLEQSLSPTASLEEGMLRLQAAERFLELTGDEQEYARLVGRLERTTARSLFMRARMREMEGGGLAGLLARARLAADGLFWPLRERLHGFTSE